MKTQMTLSAREQMNIRLTHLLVMAVRRPLIAITSYYSQLLERRLSIRQTLHLLNAQLAFFFTVFPAGCHLFVRVACLCWLINALLRCRRAL